MRVIQFRLTIASALLLLCALPASAQNSVEPELILKNGRVFSDKSEGPRWNQAISVRHGLVLAVGTNALVEKDKGPSTKVIDLKGRVVLPAFNDAHMHIFSAGLNLSRLDLTGVKSIQEMKTRLKDYLGANPMRKTVFGFGWDHTAFAGQKYPSRIDLDEVVMDKPVILEHTDGHLIVANTKAFELAGVSEATPDPKDGKILKTESGKLQGVLLENAASLLTEKLDRPTFQELKEAFLAAQSQALKAGVTSIQGPFSNERLEDHLKVIEELYREKKLKLRIGLWGNLENPAQFSEMKEKYKSVPEEWLKFVSLKGFVDGVISARTAALIDPYEDEKATRGTPNYTQEKLDELVLKANRSGFSVALHAVGDKAVGMALTAFYDVRKKLFNSRVRNRIEHVELSHPPFYKRFESLGVIASVQPSHMIYDQESENYNDLRLGKARVQHAFAWKNFKEAGAQLAFGTDWPVMPVNPFIGLFGAVFRQHYNGKPAGGWIPAQKIDLESAIEAYTSGSAFASHEEHIKGTLRSGMFADFIVLGSDPFKARGTELLKTKVDHTYVMGVEAN